MVSRAGSPSWLAMEGYTIQTDMSTGRTFACGGSFFATPDAEGTYVQDWPCTPTGEPIPTFRRGITGIAQPKQRRKQPWLLRREPAQWEPKTHRIQTLSPRRMGRRPEHVVRARQAAACAQSDRQRGFRMQPVPPTHVCQGRDKAIWRRAHPGAWAHELEQRRKDGVLLAKNRKRAVQAEKLLSERLAHEAHEAHAAAAAAAAAAEQQRAALEHTQWLSTQPVPAQFKLSDCVPGDSVRWDAPPQRIQHSGWTGLVSAA
jgi:hypothetical protein